MIFDQRKFLKAACGVTFGLALLGQFMASALAESETSEQWRLERFNKQNGGSFTSGKTTSAFRGGAGPATTDTEIVVEKAQIPMLSANSGASLLTAQTKYSAIVAQGGFPKVPNSNYKKGAQGAGVAILNKRLFIEGYLRVEGTQGDVADIYTTATEDAVSRYQRNMGLSATGKADNGTLAELNISADQRLQAISANIPRFALYQRDLGDRYIVVNIPAQQLETVSGGKVYSRQNLIVGRPERPTPVVMTPLVTVKFNPYWNAPVSIVERDIIPQLLVNRQFLKNMNMKVFQGVGGPEIDPATVNWKTAVPDNYAFRQEPGPENAMKTAKIEFNSPFGIYMHDTPEPQLFKTNNRFYSSGCIRVENMPILLNWVLNGQDGFNESKIASMAQTLERLDVKLVAPPQLRVAYLTAWPTANGTVAFRRDIYNLDNSGFTVGQPMPLGEKSPDGLRYVLKPLPRQIPIDQAEAEGFNLFGFRPKPPSGDPIASKKNIFGNAVFSTASKSAGATAFKVDVTSPVVKNVKGKKGKTELAGAKTGVFDWVAYRKQQAIGAGLPEGKKKKKARDIAAKVKIDSKKLKTDKKVASADPASKVTIKAPKKLKASIALADPCAPINGKEPADCLPTKK